MGKVIFILVWLFCGIVHAEPRLDLYKKIKKVTGVSLKEAFQAVNGTNISAVTDLQIYARRIGIRNIEKGLEDEINDRKIYCKKKRSLSCEQGTQDLTSQLDFVRNLHSKYDSLSGYEKLYYSLLVYGSDIKTKILKNDLDDWEKNCSQQDKINTKPCQEKLFETHLLFDIANDIGKVAATKSNNQNSTDNELNRSIKERISRYEIL